MYPLNLCSQYLAVFCLFAIPVFAFGQSAPVIDVWYGSSQEFGNNGEPQVWCNIPGNVSDSDGSISTFEYTLNGGSPVSLTIGPDGRRLLNSGDFNIDIDAADLVPGSNTVEITAIDDDSNTTIEIVTINYSAGNTWPVPYTVDWSTLSGIEEVNDVAHVVDGKWELTPNGIRTTEPGYDRLIAIGDKTWTNYEILVPVTIHDMPGGGGVGVLLRWKGHTDNPVDCGQPKCGWQPLGDIAWYRPGELEFYEGSNTSRSLSEGTTYMYRASVNTDISGDTDYKLKVWEQGTAEPPTWDLEKTTGPSDEQQGSLLLITHKADVTFGNVEISAGSLSLNNIGVQLANGNTEATITWTTNQPADSRVDFGPSCAYEDGFQESSALTTNHSVTLTNLSPNSVYRYQITSSTSGNTVASQCLTFSTFSSGIASDDFCDGTLNPVWTFYDPLSDASYSLTGSGTNDSWLELSVPAGTEHQLYTAGIEAANMLQPVNNADFEVEVKFESPVNTQYQEQGILVKESANKFLRFEFYSDNSGQTHIYAQGFNLPSNTSALIDNSIVATGTAPLYMRVERNGNNWSQTYSFDGQNWMQGASFTYALTPTEIGPYAGNAIGSGSPAHTAQIDYFENLADPIASEDGCSVNQPPVLAAIGDQTLEEGESLNVGLSASDPDGNDSDIEFSATGLPGFAQLLDNNDGTAELQINPQAGDAGTYGITIEVTDGDLLTDSETLDIIVTSGGTGPSNLVSDDFCDGTLGSAWTFVDPQSDSSQGFNDDGTDGWAEVSVPAGTDHELWDEGIQAPHIIQPANDVDMEVTVKMLSPVVSPQYQEQGVMFKQDDNNFLRFEFYSSNSNTNIIAAILSGTGTPLNSNIVNNSDIVPLNTSPLFMRIQRTGDSWTQEYSTDGSTWTTAATFSYAMNVNGVGLYAGNAGGNPAHTAQFDYFESSDNPLTGEDDCLEATQTLNGSVSVPSDCDGRELVLKVYDVGTTTLLYDLSTSVDQNGEFSVDNIPTGTYDIFLTLDGYLQKGLLAQTLNSGTTSIAFGALEEGDTDSDNRINAADLSGVIFSNNTSNGDPDFDILRDFDCSGTVNGIDINLLIGNFNTLGDSPGSP